MRKNTILIILIAFLVSVLNITPAMATGETILNRDGIMITNAGQKTIKNDKVIKAERTPDLKQVYSVTFFHQSTIVDQQANGKYYRTVGYDMRLADRNKNPLTEYIYFNYDSYRREYIEYMRNLIKSDPKLEFGKPYASEEIMYREYFLKHFPAEVLDKAKYLDIKGIVEIYEVSGSSEKVLYRITKDNWKKEYPYGFEKLRSDINLTGIVSRETIPVPF